MEIILDVGGNCRVGSIDSVGHVGVYDGRIISWLCQLPIHSNGHDFSFSQSAYPGCSQITRRIYFGIRDKCITQPEKQVTSW